MNPHRLPGGGAVAPFGEQEVTEAHLEQVRLDVRFGEHFHSVPRLAGGLDTRVHRPPCGLELGNRARSGRTMSARRSRQRVRAGAASAVTLAASCRRVVILTTSGFSQNNASPAARRSHATATQKTGIHEPAASMISAAPQPAKIEARPFAVYWMP